MTARDFLDVAYDLLGGTREADWRSAASRAYYAGFHGARDFFVAAGFAVPLTEQAHVYLWRRLSNCGHRDLQHAGSLMDELRGVRNWADYDLAHGFDQSTAYDAVRRIDDVLQLLQALPTVLETHERIIDQMRTYEKNVLREDTWKGQ
jgi:uncharacterized protein (UPF0332 family)